MTTSHRWKRRPEHSNWGDFGPDDQLGAMNLVGKAQVLKGLAEVRTEHGVQGRAVMIDLFKHFGRANHAVTHHELQEILHRDGIVIETGDMVCLYSGLDDVILGMGQEPDTEMLHNSCSGLDGGDKALLSWITDTGIAALISDNFAIELMPRAQRQQTSHAMLPLHEHCLFKNGVHLGELWFLRDLATWLRDNGGNRFLLTAPPLHLPGGVASPVTPVATV
jgi:hypothetical protein